MKRLLLLTLMSFTLNSFANKALTIMEKSRDANNGYIGETSEMEMVLISKTGDKVIRKLNTIVKEIDDDGDKSLSTFVLPKDVAGTKMLTWSHKETDDDQWLYMPTLKKVKKITSSGRSASFMGSEFSYEDLGSQEVERFTYKLIEDNKTHWIIERYPKDKKSSYTKHKLNLSKKYMIADYIEYYNRRNELFKKSDFSGFKEFNIKGKKMYRAAKVHMKNLKNGKESIVIWHDRKLGVSHKNNSFKKEGLRESF